MVSYQGVHMHIKYKGACQGRSRTNGGHGFLAVRCERRLSMRQLQLGACSLSAVRNREGPVVGGYLYTSATAGVLYREVVRWWEGPLGHAK